MMTISKWERGGVYYGFCYMTSEWKSILTYVGNDSAFPDLDLRIYWNNIRLPVESDWPVCQYDYYIYTGKLRRSG